MKTEHQTLIDGVFTESLTPAEEAEVLHLQETDVSFRKSLELHLSLRDAITEERAKDPITRIVAEASERMIAQHPDLLVPRSRLASFMSTVPRTAWMAAASVLLLLTITFGWRQHQYYGDEVMAQRHLIKPPNPRLAIANASVDNQLTLAQKAFFNGDFTGAKQQYEAILAQGKDFPVRARYYLAHADLELGNYATAQQHLLIALSDEDGDRFLPTLAPPRPALTPSEIKLGRWNLLLTRLALGEDVSQQLGTTVTDDFETRLPKLKPWPDAWEEPLREDLGAWWRW